MRAARTDKNQKEIVEYYRKCGATVCVTSNVHKGFPDIVVGYRGLTDLVEIKSEGGKLTPDQIEFFEDWYGAARVVDSLDGVEYHLKEMLYKAEMLDLFEDAKGLVADYYEI